MAWCNCKVISASSAAYSAAVSTVTWLKVTCLAPLPATCSKRVPAPVKLLWTREDDMTDGRRGWIEVVVEDDGPGLAPEQIGEALKRGAVRVEPSAEAQAAYIAHLRSIAVDNSEYVTECTPSYFNNEGDDTKKRHIFGEPWGEGYYAFEAMLKEWPIYLLSQALMALMLGI